MKFFQLAITAIIACLPAVNANAQPLRKILHGQAPFRDALFGSKSTCGADGSCGSAAPAEACAPAYAPAMVTSGGVKTAAAPAATVRETVFHTYVKMKVAAELRKKGHSVAEAHSLAWTLTPEMIDGAAAMVKIPVGQLGDGTILQLILDFFKSPQGQQLLAALIQMLLGLLGGL